MAQSKRGNINNLIKNEDLTPEQRRASASRAGKASARARQARKTLREELLLLLSQGDTQNKISLAMIQQALTGNVKAFETIRDTIGEKPIDKQEVTGNMEVQKVFITEKEQKEVEKHIDDVINE